MIVADPNAPLAPFYKGWDTYNDYLVDITGKLTQEQLAQASCCRTDWRATASQRGVLAFRWSAPGPSAAR